MVDSQNSLANTIKKSQGGLPVIFDVAGGKNNNCMWVMGS
jgi:hypothetical protein